MDPTKILFTGGSGLLGGEVRSLVPEAQYPAHQQFDVTDFEGMRAYAAQHPFTLLVHAAAATSPPRIEAEPMAALEANIIGTANVVRLCAAQGARLIYISTDYVFRGDRGMYREDDPVYPVNKYAWSKLGGECAARLYDRSLIVRTTFGPNVFPYEKAFVDQWTSRESVREVARKLVRLFDGDLTGVIHVGGGRRTVYEYARSLDASKPIGELSIHDVSFPVPVDTSLDCRRYNEQFGQEA